MDTLETIAVHVGAGLTILSLLAFMVIVAWAVLRPHESIEAEAQLWNDDEK